MKASKGRCVKRGQESPSVGRGRVTSRPMCSSSTSAGHLTEEQPQAHREPSQRRPHRQEQPHCPDSQTNPRYWVAVNEEVDRRQVQKLLYSQSFSRQRDGERRASAKTYQPNLHRQSRANPDIGTNGLRASHWTHPMRRAASAGQPVPAAVAP